MSSAATHYEDWSARVTSMNDAGYIPELMDAMEALGIGKRHSELKRDDN